MVPAHQRLEALQGGLAVKPHDGLVAQEELLPGDGPPEVRLHGQQVAGAGEHGPGEDLEAVAPGLLGLVHGQVGVAQQVFRGVGLVRVQGDAQAGGELDVVAVHGQRHGQGLADALDGLDGLARGDELLQQDHEFVAAEARNRVQPAHAFAQHFGHGHEHLVAKGVAKAVVQDLEAVQVQKDQGEVVGLAAVGALHGLAHAVQAQGAVGQGGQRIVQGQVAQLQLHLLAAGDVAQGDARAERPAVAAHDLALGLADPAQVAVLVPDAEVQVVVHAQEPVGVEASPGVQVLGVDKLLQRTVIAQKIFA